MLSLIVDSRLRLPLGQLSPELLERIKKEFEFKNPQYFINKAMKKSTWGVYETIRGWRQTQKELKLPRGATSILLNFLKEEGIKHQIINKTRILPKVDFKFNGELWDLQKPAVEAILGRKFSTMCAPTGSGKSFCGLYTIAMRQQPALVIVHTKDLAKQWMSMAAGSNKYEPLLDITHDEIGIIGDDKFKIGERLTIGLAQTLHKCNKDITKYFGYVVMDEVHHVAAPLFSKSIGLFDSAMMCGLSATLTRRDKMERMIGWYIGPTVYEVPSKELIDAGKTLLVEPVIRNTEFRSELEDPTWSRALLINELVHDEARNILIVKDVVNEAKNGELCVVLSDRKLHCEILTEMLEREGIKAKTVHGDIKDRESILEDLSEGKVRVIVATGSLLGEGFDEKKLSRLFLASPIRFSGRVTQFLGRVGRGATNKENALVYDYRDQYVEVLEKAFEERMRTYRRLKKKALKG